jgi:hypothetical protein
MLVADIKVLVADIENTDCGFLEIEDVIHRRKELSKKLDFVKEIIGNLTYYCSFLNFILMFNFYNIN